MPGGLECRCPHNPFGWMAPPVRTKARSKPLQNVRQRQWLGRTDAVPLPANSNIAPADGCTAFKIPPPDAAATLRAGERHARLGDRLPQGQGQGVLYARTLE